jgi:DNA-binding response OmpR family regulator
MKSSGASALSKVQHWRQCGRRVPILALSSPDGPGDLTSAVNAWLAKPFGLNALVARLHALVRGA